MLVTDGARIRASAALRENVLKVISAALGLFAIAPCLYPLAVAQTPPRPAPGAAAAAYVAPRTVFGQPSLEGAWTHNYFVILEAPKGVPDLVVSEADAKAITAKVTNAMAEQFEKGLDPEIPDIVRSTDGLALVRGERRTRSVVLPADGKLPYTPEAREELSQRKPGQMNNPEERPNWERCVTDIGLPPVTSIGSAKLNPWMIVQTADYVVIHSEHGGETRIIPLADKHRPAVLHPVLGDSIAHWEGDTLVVETTGLPAKERIRGVSNLIVPPDSTVTESYTRVSDNELLYQYTVTDPKTYSAPWRAEYSLYRTNERIYEHACHEGNYSLANVLRGARVLEAQAAAPAK
jgi:hypothetical protein